MPGPEGSQREGVTETGDCGAKRSLKIGQGMCQPVLVLQGRSPGYYALRKTPSLPPSPPFFTNVPTGWTPQKPEDLEPIEICIPEQEACGKKGTGELEGLLQDVASSLGCAGV